MPLDAEGADVRSDQSGRTLTRTEVRTSGWPMLSRVAEPIDSLGSSLVQPRRLAEYAGEEDRH